MLGLGHDHPLNRVASKVLACAEISSAETATAAPTAPTATPSTIAVLATGPAIRRRPTAHSILTVLVEALGIRTAGRAILVVALLVLLSIGFAIGVLLLIGLLILLHVGLRIRMLLLVTGLVLLRLLLRLLGIHALPGIGAVVIFLPTGAVVLIDVAVVASVHIAAGRFARIGITVGGGGAVGFTTFRTLRRSNGSVGGGVVLGVGGLIAVLDVGLAPLRGGTRALMCSAIGSGVGVVGLPGALMTIGSRNGGAFLIRAGVRIIRSCVSLGAVRTIGGRGNAICTGAGVVVRSAVGTVAVRSGVRMIDGIAVRRITDVRGIVVTGAAANDRADSSTHDESAEIASGITGLNVAVGGGGLHHVGNVVDRRAWRDGVDDLRNGVGGGPGTLRSGGHEPDALKAQIIDVAHLNDLIGGVGGVLQRRALNRYELWRTGVGHIDLGGRGLRIDNHGGGDLRDQHGILCLRRAWDGSEDGTGGTGERNVGEVGRQSEAGEGPRTLQVRSAEPTPRREVVIRLCGAIEK